MFIYIFNLIFLLFSLFVLIQSVTYSLFEIKKENNKQGGIITILFTIFCVIFSNIVVFTH